MPTGRAHGLQIMTMCEEFAAQGAKIDLVIPAKKNFAEADPFIYYDVARSFSIRRVGVPDLGSRTSMLPHVTFLLDVLFFGIALLFSDVGRRNEIVYCRDYPLLFFLPRRNLTILEVHDVPRWTWIFKRAISRADLFVAITRGVKDALVERGGAPERILVAPDGVHLEDFANPESRENARRRLGLPLDKKIAMYIGWIDYWKGTDTLFEAATRLKGAMAVVIGALSRDLPKLRRVHPAVTFFEMRPYKELADNQAAADVLILPASGKHAISTRYTSPLKLFTYMTSGVPIVAADVPSLREVLDDRTCFWYRVGNADDLARVVEYALAHRKEGQEKALVAKELVKRYTWEERARNILLFLRDKS
ncbi:hypothetical protein A3A39_02445 [Candidatus Kaiserbacteria bacterium RIFCSPLOWO2_01_FULL_54_13]|uniref:Glycosyltransferase subfamily 4-like N-terminal domain-containing protein n=1 Tax=Candidatus Kaiserbacteria bacterium RIFCSPLOWO2_01_FULL_54_13 TaxID=1798512 RepID=A0A1F6F162_9BACT|nr:MAG: hypothetical protein A3A39_02445 [Candidatus Kaiserbacteria bacterium RIFCSPLOWO2_01_FULL_54_13]